MAVRAQRSALQGCALIVVVLLASCASMSTALSIVLDASGEPEWNLPANGSDSWTYANQSNVYGGDYGLPTVHKVAGVHTQEACQAACEKETACHSYTYTPGPEPGKPSRACKFMHDCYLRTDSVWKLRETANCAGLSGFKGTPPGPSPLPPSPPAPPPPRDALNVLFVIFE